MGAVTPGGLPYPLGTDLVVDGDNAIRALAEALDPAASTASLGMVKVAATAAARDSYWGVPAAGAPQLALQNRGATTLRTDKGWTERYYAPYNVTTNPGGVTVAGWYPIDGVTPFFEGRGQGTLTLTSGSVWTLLNAQYGATPRMAGGFTFAAGVITIPVAGFYDLTGRVAQTGAGTVGFQFTLNSAVVDTAATIMRSFLGATSETIDAKRYRFAAGDVIRVFYTTSVAASIKDVNSLVVDIGYRTPPWGG